MKKHKKKRKRNTKFDQKLSLYFKKNWNLS